MILQRRRGLKDAETSESVTTESSSSDRKILRQYQQRNRIWKNNSLLFFFSVTFAAVVYWKVELRQGKSKLQWLHIPNVDITVQNSHELPFIHIVNTRFMQDQGPLETLGMARLKLFQTFCLPSMILQSSQHFFWIIKTDPQFTTTNVFKLLIESVKPYSNIYIVSSNLNFLFGSGGLEGTWGDGKESLDLMQSKIYTGNVTTLSVAIALHDQRLILETRLDCDDGLHKGFLQYIQAVAVQRFQLRDRLFGQGEVSDNDTPRWLYWCSRRHIEWHSDTEPSLSIKQKKQIGSDELGYMNIIQHDKLCVTPGVTVGYIASSSKHVPQYDHDKLYRNVSHSYACYENTNNNRTTAGNTSMDNVGSKTGKSPCLKLVENFPFCAIRSRTWTSAGMDDVDLVKKNLLRGTDLNKFTSKLWSLSEENFGVNKKTVRETQNFLMKNKKMIAHENLLGQCTSGHSCKDAAKEKLKRLAK